VSPAPWWRLGLLAALIAALAAIGYALPLHQLATSAGRLGPLAAIGLGSALLLALVPRTVISLACGALFGALAGAGYALTSAVLSAAIAFVLGRLLGRKVVAERAGRRLARADTWLRRRGLLAVIVVRLLPLAPYGLVSYVYGTTGVRARHYLLGTLIGAAPSAVAYAGIGAAAVSPGRLHLTALAPAALGLLVSMGAAIYWWRDSHR
jgi:uncharacterized membrane protein YdjX (TVP38/TMEM64 family)